MTQAPARDSDEAKQWVRPNLLDDLRNLRSQFGDGDEPVADAESKTAVARVPVLHLFMIKELTGDGDGAPVLLGTFVQRIFGLSGVEGDEPFQYRFNEESAGDLMTFRRPEKHPFKVEGVHTPVPMSRFTYSVRVRLKRSVEFDQFPFLIYRATADIELSSRTDKTAGKVTLRPTLLLHTEERRHNVSLKAEGDSESAAQTLDKHFGFNFVSPYPQVTYFFDAEKGYTPRFRVEFMLKEEGMQKLISVQLPMLLVATLSTLNLAIDLSEDSDASSTTESSDRYLNTAATLALAVVFILPQMSIPQNSPRLFSLNDFYVFVVFVSLSIASFPPALCGKQVAITGVALLWASFIIPMVNCINYLAATNAIKKRRNRVIGDFPGKGHPFLKDSTYKGWKPSEAELRKLAHVEDVLSTSQDNAYQVKKEPENGELKRAEVSY